MLTPFNHTSHHPHHGLRSGILGGLAAILGIAVMGLATPLGMPLTAPVQAQESDVMSQANLLTVSGQGLVTVETSIAVVRLAVWLEGESAAAVQEEVAKRTNSLVEQLRQEDVQKLQTTGISLNPRYTYRDGVTEQVGVEGQNAVQFEVPIDQAGAVLDGAIEAGATQIQSVSFKAADDVIQAAREEAIRLAIADAQDQSGVALAALNLTQSGIASIDIHGSNQAPAPVSMMMADSYSASSRESAPTPVIGGEQMIQANVTLKVRY
ncbi:MAG: SIMPL domain-containing protein [Cyanophyceae cyanobacterium]